VTRTSGEKVFDLIKQKQLIGAHGLVKRLRISPQALHRHLRRLVQEGRIEKVGLAPKTRYRATASLGKDFSAAQRNIISNILADHPGVLVVSLFGSHARGDAGQNSDIDILVWITRDFRRQDIWNFWDRHSRHLPWGQNVSLIVKELKSVITIETLLLDLPEEHICLFDRGGFFEQIKRAVIRWREKNGARKIPSFGNTHAWEYSTRAGKLSEIDFNLEIGDVP
jgi:predicted nucleotidyltransferase